MKFQIRKGVFETNSSSVHSLTIFNKEDWKQFVDGKLVMTHNYWNPELVSMEGIPPKEIYEEYDGEDFYNYIRYKDLPYTAEIVTKDLDDQIIVSLYSMES